MVWGLSVWDCCPPSSLLLSSLLSAEQIWNLLEYERVMFLDADNLFVQNIDELFLCGHFCVVFMNPIYFHTGNRHFV